MPSSYRDISADSIFPCLLWGCKNAVRKKQAFITPICLSAQNTRTNHAHRASKKKEGPVKGPLHNLYKRYLKTGYMGLHREIVCENQAPSVRKISKVGMNHHSC